MSTDTESQIAPDSKNIPIAFDAFSSTINIHGGLGGPGGRVQRGGRPLEADQVISLIQGGTGGAGGAGGTAVGIMGGDSYFPGEYSEQNDWAGEGPKLAEHLVSSRKRVRTDVKAFCEQYELDAAISLLLVEEGFKTVEALSKVSDIITLKDLGLNIGQIAELKHALEEFHASLLQHSLVSPDILAEKGSDTASNPALDRHQSVWSVWNSLQAAHRFLTTPPFLYTRVAWTRKRLDARLNDLQTWVISVNGVLVGFALAMLAVSSISNSRIPRDFVILGMVFAFFGFIYTILLILYTRDHGDNFHPWFLNHPDVKNVQTRSSWTPATILYLPITWMAWAIISFLACLAALGANALEEKYRHGTIGADPPADGATETDTNESSALGANVTMPHPDTPDISSMSLDIAEFIGFTVLTVWSAVYVVKIYTEVRKCRVAHHGKV
ncbi:hypothetical protein B0H13DRAFT_1203529 [Mycena leptocephala]|nr:hypothetical protein B0H13DRAFT_1203529 [Mycena leptocephala]